jgi:hypothetical protein
MAGGTLRSGLPPKSCCITQLGHVGLDRIFGRSGMRDLGSRRLDQPRRGDAELRRQRPGRICGWACDRRDWALREVFKEIDKTLREQKAVKADGAEVPEFLWFDHLVDDGLSEWQLAQQERLAWAMKVTRARLLCWWKRILARSFWGWMKLRHRGIKEASETHSRKLLVWDEDTRKYSWSDSGQASFRLWWDGVVKEAWVDFEAGLECIERAWHATWFAWDDGPGPFFWRRPPEYIEVIQDGLPIFPFTQWERLLGRRSRSRTSGMRKPEIKSVLEIWAYRMTQPNLS